MANQTMNLPISGFKILRLIIIGYLHQGGSERKPATYDEVSKASSVSPTMVSGNNKGLAALGVLNKSQGRGSYQLTEKGYDLARALEFEEPELTRRALRPILSENQQISQALNALRARGSMNADDFAKRILIVAEAKNTNANMTGARTIIEMLVVAGLVDQVDDVLEVIRDDLTDSSETEIVEDIEDTTTNGGSEPVGDREYTASGGAPFSVRVDIAVTAEDLLDEARFDTLLQRLAQLREASEGQ